MHLEIPPGAARGVERGEIQPGALRGVIEEYCGVVTRHVAPKLKFFPLIQKSKLGGKRGSRQAYNEFQITYTRTVPSQIY